MMIRKVMPAQISAVGEDEVEAVISTGAIARDGHILVPGGADLSNYRANPIVLWQHDPEAPVGRASEIIVDGDKIRARVTFAPSGISAKADEVRGLVKSGIVSTLSVGFEPLDAEPLDPKKPRGGQRITRWELLECSFCSVPVDTGAVVTARAMSDAEWKVGASRNLPVEDSDDWDGPAAEKSIFEHAGGDDFDPAKARKGFLVYNAAEPKLRGSYKLPIAHVVDGELKVPKGAIRAAASRLPQTDIPDDVKESAGKVLDAYKKKAGIGDDEGSDKERRMKTLRTRALVAMPGKPKFRGLYDVAQLAYNLECLGYIQSCASFEADIEQDGSQVPAMLGEAMKAVGAALCAMAEEEVDELLERLGDDGEGDVEVEIVAASDRALIASAPNERIRAWRRGIARARLRAGRVLSAGNVKRLEDADANHDRAMEQHATGEEHRAKVSEQADAIGDHQAKAQAQHEKLGDALQAAKDNPQDAEDHIERAMRAYRALGKHLDAAAETQQALADSHDGAGDAHRAMARSVKAAQRSVRTVLDGAAPGSEDGDSKEIQTSDGVAEDGGARSADYRRRQADVLALAAR